MTTMKHWELDALKRSGRGLSLPQALVLVEPICWASKNHKKMPPRLAVNGLILVHVIVVKAVNC
jgi:hypothetical protein